MPRPYPPRVGAFFDVDKTILAENSGTLYLRALYERGEIDWSGLLQNLGSYLQYKLNLLDLDRWTKRTMQQFRGRSERSLTVEANRWFRDYVRPVIYPEARALIQDHAARGDRVVLVSGATKFVIHPLAHHLGVKDAVHTHLEVRDGHFTGRVIEPICFGEGKIYWLQQLIERQGIGLAKSYFYTDSITDLPLLDLVGHPQVVNPDPLLYREALRRHWPVRFFRTPHSAPDPEGSGESTEPSRAAEAAPATGTRSPRRAAGRSSPRAAASAPPRRASPPLPRS